MRIDNLISALQETLSGERARRYVEMVAGYHRIPASSGFNAALDAVRLKLEEAGLTTHVHEYPADGRTEYCGWRTPMAWDLQDGALWQIRPSKSPLGQTDETPMIVCPRSPSGVFEGKLVHVRTGDRPSHYDGVDVRGCYVLASGSVMHVAREATKQGAIGVVIYPDAHRALVSQHLRIHDQLRPGEEDLSTLIPAFSVSKWCRDQLIETMGSEEVILRAEVKGGFAKSPLRVLETAIHGDGSCEGETLLIAHLCHPYPSANDNASGSGLLIELARQLHRHTNDWGLSNTVRCLWVPEFIGSLAWSQDHVDVLRQTHCTINLDMVGQSPELIGEPLRIYRVPRSIPTFLNACIEPIMERIEKASREMAPQMVKGTAERTTTVPQGSSRPLHWILDTPASGSDHLTFMAEPHRIPSYMVAHEDPYWHTTLDTIDKVDPGRLKQVGIFALAMALLPSYASCESKRLVEWTLRYAHREMSETREAMLGLDQDTRVRLLDAALSVAQQRIRDVEKFLTHAGAAEPDKTSLSHPFAEFYAATTDSPANGSKVRKQDVPRRIGCGPLSSWFLSDLDAEDVRFLEETLSADGRPMSEFLLQACDGIRDTEEISLLLSLDLGKVVTVEDVSRGLWLLASSGYVELPESWTM